MRIINDIILDGYNLTAGCTTDGYSLKHMTGYSITASLVGGSPVGSIKLQASNDKAETGSGPTTWVDITLPVTSVTAISAAGNVVWNYSNAYYKWVRVVYTRTSGSSTLTITLNGKGL